MRAVAPVVRALAAGWAELIALAARIFLEVVRATGVLSQAVPEVLAGPARVAIAIVVSPVWDLREEATIAAEGLVEVAEGLVEAEEDLGAEAVEAAGVVAAGEGRHAIARTQLQGAPI